MIITDKSQLNNLVISVNGRGNYKDFSCLISGYLPDANFVGTGQCFPMYLFEEVDSMQRFIELMLDSIQEERRKGLNEKFYLGYLYALRDVAKFCDVPSEGICELIKKSS